MLGAMGRKGKRFMHVKVSHLATEKHHFKPKLVSEQNLIASKYFLRDMPPDPT